MRKIQIHPVSLLAGVGLASIAFVTMGQKQVPSAVVLPLSGVEELVRPSDYVRIAEGTPYQVPAGKRFILRALGRTEGPSSYVTCLRIDGVDLLLNRFGGGTAPSSVNPYPAGVFADEGSVVEIWTHNWPGGGVGGGIAVAYGFEESMSSAKQYVQVEEGTPFVVPSGKLLVPTAATSRDDYYGPVFLFLDGVKELDIGDQNMAALPKGLAISEGVTVTIELGVTGADDARLWGYLADA